jgi:high frequency lysogenization protein
MCGSVAAVDAAAHGRGADPGNAPFDTFVTPLFERNPNAAAALFPDPARLRNAVLDASSLLRGEHPRQNALMRYLLGVMDLATRLQRNGHLADDLGKRLDLIGAGAADGRVDELGKLYEDTIGTLGRRIQVVGDPATLKSPATAARIRTLLLAAIRFAILWKQLGGRRWHLVLRRQPLLVALSNLEGRL